MKEINIVSLQMIKTDSLRYLKGRVSSPEDAAEIMRSFNLKVKNKQIGR